MSTVKEFNEYRAKMNEKILAADNVVLKRLFNLDTNTYAEGALPVKTKEMLGLVASMVLRCDDCIKYHLEKCKDNGVSTAEVFEVFAVATGIYLAAALMLMAAGATFAKRFPADFRS